jgi:peptidoglycan/LPS O-acetylase OafA/YrhL
MTNKQNNEKTSIKPLISLRFVFAVMIFLHHFHVGGGALFPNGSIGVTFFFMLSGFVIALNYEEKIRFLYDTSNNYQCHIQNNFILGNGYTLDV